MGPIGLWVGLRLRRRRRNSHGWSKGCIADTIKEAIVCRRLSPFILTDFHGSQSGFVVCMCHIYLSQDLAHFHTERFCFGPHPCIIA